MKMKKTKLYRKVTYLTSDCKESDDKEEGEWHQEELDTRSVKIEGRLGMFSGKEAKRLRDDLKKFQKDMQKLRADQEALATKFQKGFAKVADVEGMGEASDSAVRDEVYYYFRRILELNSNLEY